MTAALPRRLATPSSVNAAIKQIADVMRRANYAGALQYVPELSWILFLRILDEREALGVEFSASLEAPYRWRDWAAPGGAKRFELSEGAMGAFLPFVHEAVPSTTHAMQSDEHGVMCATRQSIRRVDRGDMCASAGVDAIPGGLDDHASSPQACLVEHRVGP